MMHLFLRIFLFFFCTSMLAQEWETVSLKHFSAKDDSIIISPINQDGIAFYKSDLPDFTTRFFMDASFLFAENPAQTDAYFVFGTQVNDSLSLWAAGYSLAQKHIIFGKVDSLKNASESFQTITAKPVEIIDHRRKYVIRLIFYSGTNIITTEVNGVPMSAQMPIAVENMNVLGYWVNGKTVTFRPFVFRGFSD